MTTIKATDPVTGLSNSLSVNDPTVSAPRKVLFGTSEGSYDAMATVVPNLQSVRTYNPGNPATWPGASLPKTKYQFPIVSFKPDKTILSGAMDTALHDYFAAAPNGAWVTAWHEGNGFSSAFWGTAADFVAMHTKLYAMVKAINPTLKFGFINTCYPIYAKNQDLSQWTTPGLDFYGCDGYQGTTTRTPDDTFGGCINHIRGVNPTANWGIIETNSQNLDGTWFTDTFNYAKANNAYMYATWWTSPGGTNTTPKFDPAGPYIPALQAIANNL